MKTLEREARAGFPRMRGAHVRATVPITQEILDRMLSKLALKVEIRQQNRISITYGMVQVGAELVGVTPDLTVVLSTSWLSRTALWGVLAWKPGLQAYLRQHNKFVHIMCGQIPAVARYRYLWRHLDKVFAHTTPGRLLLDAEFHIPQDGPTTWPHH